MKVDGTVVGTSHQQSSSNQIIFSLLLVWAKRLIDESRHVLDKAGNLAC